MRCALVGVLTASPVYAAQPRLQEVTCVSHGATPAGSIAWPVDRPITAAVVFIHGSGPQKRDLDLARRFAERGIAALVYDKHRSPGGRSCAMCAISTAS